MFKSKKTGFLRGHHQGGNYVDVMSELSRRRRVGRYLEIGVNRGSLLARVQAEAAFGVDPAFILDTNVAAGKKRLNLYQATSDDFFADPGAVEAVGTPDLVFIDGFHNFDYLLRDFMNVERISDRRTLVGLHDTLPMDDVMVIRDAAEWQRKTGGTTYDGWWTGDVWKTVAILLKYRPDLRIVSVDCPPTGITFVMDLDPGNDVLAQGYREIVDEFTALPNDAARLEQFYAGFEIMPSSRLFDETGPLAAT